MGKLLIGCDPEVFMFNPNTKKYVSAWGRIEGDKNNPLKVKDGAVQVDGNALEFNIDPASDVNQFTDNVASVYSQLKAMVPGYELHAIPHVAFDKADWDLLPEEAKKLGCDPDWNVYTQKPNTIPANIGDIPERDGAGHVHLGWTEGVDLADPTHFEDCLKMVKQLEWYLGSITCAWDPDDRRRKGYGKPGAFRVKHYGVEYRYPSNIWVNTVEMQKEVFKICNKAFEDLLDGKFAPAFLSKGGYMGDPDSVSKAWLQSSIYGKRMAIDYMPRVSTYKYDVTKQFLFKINDKTGKAVKKAAAYGT